MVGATPDEDGAGHLRIGHRRRAVESRRGDSHGFTVCRSGEAMSTRRASRPGCSIVRLIAVRRTNDDGAPHGILFTDGAPGADLMLPGARFSRRFDRPGRFEHACAVHPYLTAKVAVSAS